MNDRFDLVEIMNTLLKWKKQLLGITLVALVASLILAFLIPRKFVSDTLFYPGNPVIGDRSNLFRNDFEAQYDYFGDAADLDRLFAISTSSLMKTLLVRNFGLVNHYRINAALPDAMDRAGRELEHHMDIEKTELGNVSVSVKDRDANMAAALANAVVEKTDSLNNGFLLLVRERIILALQNGLRDISSGDSLYSEKQRYRQQIDQFTASAEGHIPSLYVLEKAYPADKAEFPVRWIIVLVATGSVLLLSMMTVLMQDYYHKLKSNRPDVS